MMSKCVCEDTLMDTTDVNKFSLTEFDNEPSYYKSNIHPMLAAGHEGELLNWLKTIGLLQQNQSCDNIIDNIVCSGVMTWSPAKIIDQYYLKCKKCFKKATIRSKSIFQDVRCHFRDIIRLVVGWCKGIDDETMSNFLCIKKQTVLKVYYICAQTASTYINLNISKWKLGGPESIVLVDTYPEGLLKYENQDFTMNKAISPILCIMEVQSIPQRYWLQVLDKYNINNSQQISEVSKAALEIIQQIVVPGSVIVTNGETKVCSYEVMLSLKEIYPVIVTIESLKRHNTVANSIFDNLEFIWQPAISTCQNIYTSSNLQMQNLVVRSLWNQQFKQEAFEMLLNQMCYNFK